MKKVASNAGLWTNCGGYIQAATDYVAAYGSDYGAAASEGTLAHALGCDLIERMRHTGDPSPHVPEVFGGEVVPSTMRVKVRDYAHMCLTWMRRSGVFGGDALWVEKSVDCTFLEEGNTTRVDFGMYDDKVKRLFVCDLKYGHRKVKVENNPQLIINARAMKDELEAAGKDPRTFSLNIYQPNGPDADIPLSQVLYSADEIVSKSDAICELYHDTEQALTPGGHCLRCNARGTCSALRASSYLVCDYVARYTGMPEVIPTDRLEVLLEECAAMKDMLRAYETGLEALITSRIKTREVFPHWEYSTNLSDRKWALSDREILDVGKALGIDLAKNAVQSPRQAELLGVPEEVVASLTKRDSTGLKLRKRSLKTLKQAFK